MFRAIFSIGFVQVIGIFINAGRAKLFALLLGPAGFGIVATIDQLVVSMSQFFNLSVPFTALKFLSRSHSIGEAEFKRAHGLFLRIMLILALAATALAWTIAYFGLARLDPQLAAYRRPVLIALGGIPAAMLLMYFANAFAAKQESVKSMLLTVGVGLVALICGAAGCLFAGITGLYAATVLGTTLFLGGVIVFTRKSMLSSRARSDGSAFSLRPSREVIETSVCRYIAVCSVSALYLFARYESLSRVSAEGAGLMQACLGTALSIGAILTSATGLYFIPNVNRAIPVQDKIGMANDFILRLVCLYGLTALPVLLFPKLILHLLFSTRFVTAAPLLLWFILWQFLYVVANVYQQLLVGLNDERGYAVVTALGNLFSGLACAVLVRKYGLTGIAAAFVAGAIATLVLTVARLRKLHGVSAHSSGYGSVIFVVMGIAGIGALNQAASEATPRGIMSRLFVAAFFSCGLWRLLPAHVRAEIKVACSKGILLFKLKSS